MGEIHGVRGCRRSGAGLLRIAGLVSGCVLIAFAGCGDDGPMNPPRGRTIDVEVGDFFFQPVIVEAQVGDTIRWTQTGVIPHTATSGERGTSGEGSLFDFELVEVGDVAELELTAPDTIPYFCIPHFGMNGSIIVTP